MSWQKNMIQKVKWGFEYSVQNLSSFCIAQENYVQLQF